MVNVTTAPTALQIKVIEALLKGDSREEAAKAAGCSERTLYRYQTLPHFQTELRRQRTRVLDGVATVLASGSASCARILIAIAVGDVRAVPARVAAAKAVCDLAMKLEDSSTIEARLFQLEEEADRQDKRAPLGMRSYPT